MNTDMNGNTNGQLLTLMRLRAGQLSNVAAQSLHQQIRADERLANRWHLLNEQWEDSLLSYDESLEMQEDADLVAAFVEGSLDERRSLEFENRAWKSSYLLAELTAAFQFLYLPQPTSRQLSNDSGFEKRILEKVLAAVQKQSPSAESNGNENGLAKLVQAKAIEKPKIRLPNSAENQRKKAARITIGFLATAAALAIFASLAFWTLNRDSGRNVANPDDPKSGNTTDDSSENSPDLVNNDGGPIETLDGNENDVAESPKPEKSVLDPEPDTIRSPEQLAVDEELRQFEELLNDPFRKAPEPETESPPKRDRAIVNDLIPIPRIVNSTLRPTWSTVKGLLGVRDRASDEIVGYNFVSEMTDDMTVVALPNSWGEGVVDSLGQVVIDADTELRINKLETMSIPAGSDLNGSDAEVENTKFSLRLLSGRIGLKNLNDGVDLDLNFGRNSWPIQVESSDTSLAIDSYSGTPILAVRKGKIKIAGQSIGRGQSVAWRRGQFTNAISTQQNLRWMDRAETYVKLPEDIQNALMASHELTAELAKLKTSRNKDLQIAGRAWTLSLQPKLATRIFSGQNPDQWHDAFDWLLQQHRAGANRRAVWTSLSDMTGDAEFVRYIFTWSRKIEFKQAPTRDEAEKMITYLNNDQLFIRYAAARILDICFGNSSTYSPGMNQQNRVRAGRLWRTQILSAIHGKERKNNRSDNRR